MTPEGTHHRQADATNVRLRDAPYAGGEDFDHHRRIDDDQDGTLVGFGLPWVSSGVNRDD